MPSKVGVRWQGNVNHLDDGAPVLKDLRAAAESLKRMLKAEFPS